jgi:Protein of unknown function (DUF1822)
MNSTQPQRLNVPISKNAHRWAEEFAGEQDTPSKGKQVYLNTLAVYAVHSYLKWLNIETALNQGDSWHRCLRAIFDVADLVLPGVGKLECRPVLPQEAAIILPTEVMQDRIGYMAVQFNQQLDSVELLGFAREASETLQIANLQSLDTLIETIHQQKQLVNLRQWIAGIFNPDWQPAELLLAGNFRSSMTAIRPAITAMPNSMSRAKIIDLVPQIVALLQLTPTNSEVFDIRLRVYPGDNSIHLPPDLQLILLDEAGKTCMEAQAKSADDWMQLEFSCQHEEKFSVKFVLGERSFIEQFAV